jgi:hypothetical protein
LELDLYVHTGGDIEFTQRIDGLLRRFENIEESFVRANLELISRFLVNMRGSINRESLDSRG